MYVTTLYIYHCYSISSFFTLFSFPTGYGMHLALVAHTTIQEVTTTTMNHCSISCMVLCRKFWYTGCTTWTWFLFDFSLTTPCTQKKYDWVLTEAHCSSSFALYLLLSDIFWSSIIFAEASIYVLLSLPTVFSALQIHTKELKWRDTDDQ